MTKPYYEEDGITVYHGDCREILPELSGINLTVTSPPYNTLGSRMPAEGSGMKRGSGWIKKINDHGYADDMDEGEYQEWQAEVADVILGASTPGASFFYNHKIRYRNMVPVHPLDIVRSFDGWRLRQEIIWSRPGSLVLNARMFPPSEERIYWMVAGTDNFKWNNEANQWMSVWNITPVMNSNNEHSCPFPSGIPDRAILATTDPGDTVLDPFSGTGTVVRSAKDLGRRGIAIEIEERYCELIVNNLAQGVLFG